MYYKCTSIETVTLSNNITTISFHCFKGCSKFHTCSIPSNVDTIESGVFFETKITSIYILVVVSDQ